MDHVAVIEHNDYRSLYQACLEHCNNHDFGSMASFYGPGAPEW